MLFRLFRTAPTGSLDKGKHMTTFADKAAAQKAAAEAAAQEARIQGFRDLAAAITDLISAVEGGAYEGDDAVAELQMRSGALASYDAEQHPGATADDEASFAAAISAAETALG